MDKLTEKGLRYLATVHPFLYTMLLYHRTHLEQPIGFKRHRYLHDIYKDPARAVTIIKSTQSGLSEYLIGRALYNAISDRNVLYILPTDNLKARFVNARFDKTIHASPFYRDKVRDTNSVTLKGFNNGVINFIGSNSASNFAEFVAHDVIIDELDLCNQGNLAMAVERQSSIPAADRTLLKISNPTIQGYGIDYEYTKTDKKQWMIKCECGQWFTPDFFKNIVEEVSDGDYVLRDREWDYNSPRDIDLICQSCNRAIDRFAPGQWVAAARSEVSGYRISKLFSTQVAVKELVERFNDGQSNDAKMQRFYNGDLGEAYTAAGAKLTGEMITAAIREYNPKAGTAAPCVIGIDVGSMMNVIIAELAPEESRTVARVIFIGEVRDENEVIDLFRRFNIKCGVIDSRPEMRMSRRLAATLPGLFMGEYLTDNPRDMINIDARSFKTDRTTSMDGVKEAVLLQSVAFPRNAASVPGFMDQMIAPTRVWIADKDSVTEGRYIWTEGNQADHYFHAVNYMLMAKKILIMGSQ